MNVREAMRIADPAQHLHSRALSDADEQLMRGILASPIALTHQPDPTPALSAPPRRAWRPVVTTGFVAILVVLGTVLAIRSVPVAPTPATMPTATSSTSAALQTAVDAKLAAAAKSDHLDPDIPSQTWSNQAQGAQGGLIDLTGKTFYIAAACSGGGAITITIAGQLDTTIDCTTTAVIGPINLTAIAAKAKKGLGYDVAASQGQPEYYAKGIAVTSTSVTTTSSVDINGRTLLIYPASGAGGPQALLHGVLTQNQAGCITVGKVVLVAPSNAELHSDGSLSFGNTTLTLGSKVNLGGATAASIPAGSPCQAATGNYFILGDYPQPN